mgnify:CR=1 FL=1|tara:strand:- start:4498 stop:4701 length:204 start_codon:yes stop_codon:yes gene_type:complete
MSTVFNKDFKHVLTQVTEQNVADMERDYKLGKARDYLRLHNIDRCDPNNRHVYTNANGETINLEQDK